MNALLKSNEISLKGHWNLVAGEMKQDKICERIQWLTDSVLCEISVNGDSWTALYKDPADGRYWEFSYPQGYMHGGGPPALQVITEQEAHDKYAF